MGRPASARRGGPAAAGFSRRRLFGFTLASDFAFTRPLPPAAGEPDLVFSGAARAGAEPAWRGLEPVFRSPLRRGGESVSKLYRLDGIELLEFDGIVDFELRDRRIDYLLRDPTHHWLVELRLLGPVMSYWMERRGLLCLHASAVAVGGRAVLFLAAGGGGKTTLAASLLAAGHALLSDDIAAVEARTGGFASRPGYPEMRMWPDTARRFLDRPEGLPRAHPGLEKLRVPVAPGRFGRFRDRPLPLGCVYLPERRQKSGPDEVEIAPVDPRPALIELLGRSFSPHLVEAAGLQAGRLERLGRLATEVPVRRLSYPAGERHLEAVAEAVLADLA